MNVDKKILGLEAKVRFLELIIYKLSRELELSTGQLNTVSQIYDRYKDFYKEGQYD